MILILKMKLMINVQNAGNKQNGLTSEKDIEYFVHQNVVITIKKDWKENKTLLKRVQ